MPAQDKGSDSCSGGLKLQRFLVSSEIFSSHAYRNMARHLSPCAHRNPTVCTTEKDMWSRILTWDRKRRKLKDGVLNSRPRSPSFLRFWKWEYSLIFRLINFPFEVSCSDLKYVKCVSLFGTNLKWATFYFTNYLKL